MEIGSTVQGIKDYAAKHSTEVALVLSVAQGMLTAVDSGMPWWMFLGALVLVEGGKLLHINGQAAAQPKAAE